MTRNGAIREICARARTLARVIRPRVRGPEGTCLIALSFGARRRLEGHRAGALRRARLQDEGHASAISSGYHPLSGRKVVVITVTAGRPDGWSDVFGDDDLELSAVERAHFGLDDTHEVLASAPMAARRE